MKCKHCGIPIVKCVDPKCTCSDFREGGGYTHGHRYTHYCRSVKVILGSEYTNNAYTSSHWDLATPETEEAPMLEIVLNEM